MSDLISRQAVLDVIRSKHCDICRNIDVKFIDWHCNNCDYYEAMSDIEDLPSADFVEYLLDVISPNEMEMYRKMYEERAKYNG